MRYVQRDRAGKICAHFANPQPYAAEALEDGHPDLVAWNEQRAAARKLAREREGYAVTLARIATLERQVAALAAELQALKGRK